MSTLRRHQCNPSRVVQTARMIHSSSGKHTLVVEGDTDFRLFRQWLVERNARLENVGGKSNVIEVWKSAKHSRFENLHCLADVDYDLVIGGQPIVDGQFIYVSLDAGSSADVESNDLESALVRSNALVKIMSQKYRGNDLYNDFTERVEKLRELLRVASNVIGSFRAADQKIYEETGRSPIGGDFRINSLFFDATSVKLNLSDLCESLLRSTRLSNASMQELLELAGDLRTKFGSGWQLSRGHDIAEMLALHVSTVIGRNVRCEDIEEDLRMACELETIRATRFGAMLLKIGSSSGKPLFSA